MLLETANEPSGGQEAFARDGLMLNARGRRYDDTFSTNDGAGQSPRQTFPRAEPSDTTPTRVTGTTFMRSGAPFLRCFCCSSARHGQN